MGWSGSSGGNQGETLRWKGVPRSAPAMDEMSRAVWLMRSVSVDSTKDRTCVRPVRRRTPARLGT
jgi:hypothetical protein